MECVHVKRSLRFGIASDSRRIRVYELCFSFAVVEIPAEIREAGERFGVVGLPDQLWTPIGLEEVVKTMADKFPDHLRNKARDKVCTRIVIDNSFFFGGQLLVA